MTHPPVDLSFLLVWVLVVFGAAEALAVLTVGAPLRWLGRATGTSAFFECPMCEAYWCGVGLSYLWAPVTVSPWVDGFVGVASILLLHLVAIKLGLFDL